MGDERLSGDAGLLIREADEMRTLSDPASIAYQRASHLIAFAGIPSVGVGASFDQSVLVE